MCKLSKQIITSISLRSIVHVYFTVFTNSPQRPSGGLEGTRGATAPLVKSLAPLWPPSNFV